MKPTKLLTKFNFGCAFVVSIDLARVLNYGKKGNCDKAGVGSPLSDFDCAFPSILSNSSLENFDLWEQS